MQLSKFPEYIGRFLLLYSIISEIKIQLNLILEIIFQISLMCYRKYPT